MGASACPDDYVPIYNTSVCETRLDEKNYVYIIYIYIFVNIGVNSQ